MDEFIKTVKRMYEDKKDSVNRPDYLEIVEELINLESSWIDGEFTTFSEFVQYQLKTN